MEKPRAVCINPCLRPAGSATMQTRASIPTETKDVWGYTTDDSDTDSAADAAQAGAAAVPADDAERHQARTPKQAAGDHARVKSRAASDIGSRHASTRHPVRGPVVGAQPVPAARPRTAAATITKTQSRADDEPVPVDYTATTQMILPPDVRSLLSGLSWFNDDVARPVTPLPVVPVSTDLRARTIDIGSGGPGVDTCCSIETTSQLYTAQREALHRLRILERTVDAATLQRAVELELAPLRAFDATLDDIGARARARVDVLESFVTSARDVKDQFASQHMARAQTAHAKLAALHEAKRDRLRVRLERLVTDVRDFAAEVAAQVSTVPLLSDAFSKLQAILATQWTDTLLYAKSLSNALHALFARADKLFTEVETKLQNRTAEQVNSALAQARADAVRVDASIVSNEANIAKLAALDKTPDMHNQLIIAQTQLMELRESREQTVKRIAALTVAADALHMLPVLDALRTHAARNEALEVTLRSFVTDAGHVSFNFQIKDGAVMAALDRLVRDNAAYTQASIHDAVLAAASELSALQLELDAARAQLESQVQLARAEASAAIASTQLLLGQGAKSREEAHQTMAHLQNAWQDLVRANTDIPRARITCLQNCILAHVTKSVK